MEKVVRLFNKGTHDLLDAEIIPDGSAKSSYNFVNKDGRVVLVGGRRLVGTEGALGGITGLHIGYKTNGDEVVYRKAGTKIQYWDGSVWQDSITGLIAGTEVTFSNYSSLAGSFTFVNCADVYYKIVNALPANPIDIFNPYKNYKGFILIDKGRTLLWSRTEDKTGLYGSKIDRQDSNSYTSVTNEVIGTGDGATKTFTNTLAFKGRDTTNKVFTVVAATDIFTSTAHGFVTGDLVRPATDGTLPAGLSASISYYIFRLTANTYQLYTYSETPTLVDVTSAGTGTHNMSEYGLKRNCFGLQITDGTETFTDNYDGTLTGSAGGTGTINYVTGAVSVTFNANVTNLVDVKCSYQWEDSTNNNIADFTQSVPRVASEGFQFPQDEGGDAILSVQVGQDGAYYSMKSKSAYSLVIDSSDTNAENQIYRKDMGLPYFRSVISTNRGIMFINTVNPTSPKMMILQRNKVSLDVEPYELFTHFDFSKYVFDECAFGAYDRWVLVFCKSKDATVNDTILMCDIQGKTVNVVKYTGRISVQYGSELFVGDSIGNSVYSIFSGYDDLGLAVEAEWEGKDDLLGSESLKKVRRLRVKGFIDPDQSVDVFVDTDEAGYQKIGTILGSGSYVNYNETQAIGSNFIGESQVGGDDISTAYGYYVELKMKVGKFRKINIKFVPTSIGYFDFNLTSLWDIMVFEERIPKAYRTKQ